MPKDDPQSAALAYLKLGWAVIPIQPRSKRPLIRWQEFQERRPTEGEVRDWFARRPDANVGVVTGAVSNLVVIDVDPRHGGDEGLARLEWQHGMLPDTAEAATGGGGRHLYFAHPGGELRNRAGLAPGVDLRGDGGLIVAPPSMHPSGKRYEWRIPPNEQPPAPMPAWLVGLARGDGSGARHSLAYWRDRVRKPVPEGKRNNTIASLTGHLLWRDVDPEVALELLLCWNRVRCQPPLTDDEVTRTVESITKTHFRHRAEDEAT